MVDLHDKGVSTRGGVVDVVFLQMGGPTSQGEVKTFLRKLFSDPLLIQLPDWMRRFQGLLAWFISIFRSRGTRRMYQQIGGGSPILRITDSFSRKVEETLNGTGTAFRTHVLMRYTEPRAPVVVRRLCELQARTILLYPLYPHYSRSTTGSSLGDFMRSYWENYSGENARVLWIPDWSLETHYIGWWVDSISQKLEELGEGVEDSTLIMFSAHALPKKYVEAGDPYEDLIQGAYLRIVSELKKNHVGVQTSLSFQSQVGPLEWMGPSTSETIKDIDLERFSRIVMVPLGFVTDHIETLFEIDILYRREAEEVGITDFHMISPPNDSDQFAAGVAEHISKILEQEGILS